MTDIKLAPCPFCGSWKRDIHRTKKGTKELYQVICLECCGAGSLAYNERAAAKAWNRRKET